MSGSAASPEVQLTAFPNILVGLDLDLGGETLTTGSRRAADRALALAQAQGACVTLFHSMSADEVWVAERDEYHFVAEGLQDSGREALESVLAEFRAKSIASELVIAAERPDRAIIRQVRARGIDLVVTGKRSSAGAEDRSIGSVALHLLHDCPSAVWVVRAHTEPTRGCVLVATDLSEVGERALDVGAELARNLGEDLHVVHALQLPLQVQYEGEDASAAYQRDAASAARAKISQRLGDVKASIHVALSAPTAAILAAARRFEADVVVLGTVSRGGLPGLIIGNTAERLLGRLACSLLAVKPADFVSPLDD
jgi:universal stress protein E